MFRNLVTDIFFDLDHTLWDFDKNSALTFDMIFTANDIKLKLDDFLRVYVPINQNYWKLYREEKVTKEELRYQRLKKTFDAIGISVGDRDIDFIAEEYISNLSSFNNVFPHTVEILEYLRPNYRLHVITNGFQEIQDKKLKNAAIYHYFDYIINSEMAGVKKPHPQIFELALKKARVSPKKALMVGDNLEADILGARAVGLNVLHFNAHQEARHDVCPMIHSLDEIKTFL